MDKGHKQTSDAQESEMMNFCLYSDTRLKRFDVVTMGSATQDIFAKSDAEMITVRHHKTSEKLLAYPLGSKILIDELNFRTGGGGTNTAATFVRQGLKTGFIGKIGKDAPGYAVFKFMQDWGITFLGALGDQTGYSVVLDSEENDRTILTFKGASSTLRSEEITRVLEKLETEWLYCSSMMEESFETMKRVMHRVKERGGKIAFNPSSYQVERGVDLLKDILGITDVLILNKEEAMTLVEKQNATVKELLLTLRKYVPGIIIVTNGGEGATLFTGKEFLSVPVNPNQIVVETTGAGDAFASGFVAGMIRKFSPEQSLLLAQLNTEHVIAEYGAKHHILSAEEADTLMKKEQRIVKREEVQ